MQAYEQYKDSGIEWLGEIPAHWEVKRLKHTCNINANSLPETTPRDYEFKYVDIGNVSFVNGIEKTEDYNFKNSPSRARRIAKENDTIVSTVRTYLKAIDFINTEKSNFIYSTGFAVLEPRSINPRHLANSVRSDYFTEQVTISSRGMSYPAINATDLSNLLLILPPLPEQEAIAAFLDDKCGKIDEAVRIKEQQIKKLKELRQITIHHAVTKGINPEVEMKDSGIEWIGEIPRHWEVKRLKYIFNLGKGLTITKENLQDSGIFCVSYGEVHSKYGFEVDPLKHSLKCVDESYLSKGNESLLRRGDFIFADTSEDIEGSGNFTYLNSNEQVFAGYHTVIARPVINIVSRFLAYEFDSFNFRNQVRTRVKGVKVYSITQSILKDLSIWLPPDSEQEQIVNYLDVRTTIIDQAIARKTEQITKLNEYKQSLINDVVTGKVKVTN